MPSLSIVVAYSRLNRGIGHLNALPWPRLPTDLSRFSQLTSWHTVIMGRRTFESSEVGSVALPRRRNVVLSRSSTWTPAPGVVHAADWEEALLLSHGGFGGGGYDDGWKVRGGDEEEVFVIGGEEVYRKALESGKVERVYATEVEGEWAVDRWFPEIGEDWERVEEEDDVEEGGVRYRFVRFDRLHHVR